MIDSDKDAYGLLANHISDVVLLTDRDFGNVYVSPSVHRLLGYTPEEFLVLPYEDMLDPQSVELVFERIRQRRAEEAQGIGEKREILPFEAVMRHKAGGIVHVEVLSSRVTDDAGRFQGMCHVLRNITRRKQVEDQLDAARHELEDRVQQRTAELEQANQALAQSEELYRLLTENIAEMVCLRNLDKGCTYVSPSCEQVLGFTAEELKAIDLFSLVHQDDLARLHETIDCFATGREPPVEVIYRVRDKAGQQLWLETFVRPISKNGALDKLLLSSRDVTKRVQAQTQRDNALDEFAAIFDNALVGVVYLKGGRTVAKVNRRICEMFGYELEEVVGQSVALFHLDEEHFLDFGRRFFNDLVSQEVVDEEYPMRTKDGRTLWCKLSGKAVDPPRLENGVIWVVEDISQRKADQQLREDMDRMSRHDLKTPLMPILNLPTIIRDIGPLTEEQIELLDLIETSGYRLNQLMNLSLSLYSMEKGLYEPAFSSVDLLPLLARLRKDLHSLIESRAVQPEIRIDQRPVAPGEHVKVLAEEPLLYSMLANLLKNAVEASPHGESVQVDLSRGRQVGIAIHNLGVVPEHIRPRFFQKYVSSKPGGLGLGAYSAKLMAETMNGSISMRSDEAQGTTIAVSLPAAPQSQSS